MAIFRERKRWGKKKKVWQGLGRWGGGCDGGHGGGEVMGGFLEREREVLEKENRFLERENVEREGKGYVRRG